MQQKNNSKELVFQVTVSFFFVYRTQNFETTLYRWLFECGTRAKLTHSAGSLKFFLVTLQCAIDRFVVFDVNNKHAYKI
jgi:hypothetical protein